MSQQCHPLPPKSCQLIKPLSIVETPMWDSRWALAQKHDMLTCDMLVSERKKIPVAMVTL